MVSCPCLLKALALWHQAQLTNRAYTGWCHLFKISALVASKDAPLFSYTSKKASSMQ